MMVTRFDIIQQSDRLRILPQIPATETARFQADVYFTMAAVAQLLQLSELDILRVFKNYEWVTADLEFDERSHRLTIHDGESYTGRPLVSGVTWAGLRCIAMEFDTELTRQLARDLVIVDFELTNPQRLAAHYARLKNIPAPPALQFGLKKK